METSSSKGKTSSRGGWFVTLVLTGNITSLHLSVGNGIDDKQTNSRVSLKVKTMTFAPELVLEGKEVDQNPRWLPGLSSRLGDFTIEPYTQTYVLYYTGNRLT